MVERLVLHSLCLGYGIVITRYLNVTPGVASSFIIPLPEFWLFPAS